MNVGNFIGAAVAVKSLNGKIKPRYGKAAIGGIVFLVVFIIVSALEIYFGLKNGDYELLLLGIVGGAAFLYLFLINPYTQNPKNYRIELETNTSLINFKLFYKNKLVKVEYIIDKEGKFAFANNESKLSCLSYQDGTKMSNFTKYRVMNYFSKCLADHNLLSDKVTTTFEEL